MNHTEAAEESVRDPGDGGAAITGNGEDDREIRRSQSSR